MDLYHCSTTYMDHGHDYPRGRIDSHMGHVARMQREREMFLLNKNNGRWFGVTRLSSAGEV